MERGSECRGVVQCDQHNMKQVLERSAHRVRFIRNGSGCLPQEMLGSSPDLWMAFQPGVRGPIVPPLQHTGRGRLWDDRGRNEMQCINRTPPRMQPQAENNVCCKT